MVNAALTKSATMDSRLSTPGTDYTVHIPATSACSPCTPLLMARSYPPGAARILAISKPRDLAVVAELVDAQR